MPAVNVDVKRLSFSADPSYAARKAGNEAFLFLKNRLKLTINREKSGIRCHLALIILSGIFISLSSLIFKAI
jgi:hypothetical protein